MQFSESTIDLLQNSRILLSNIHTLQYEVIHTEFHICMNKINFFNDSTKVLSFSNLFFSYNFNHSIDLLLELVVDIITGEEILESFPSKALARSLETMATETEKRFNLFNSMSDDELSNYSSIDVALASYNHTVPLKKLQYPEPFIASPSFIHTDIGFIHVLQYNYWLWFLFIWMIVFFFITFLCTVRWCNMRVKPRRETRGVSRSKCGDLITACVPITWAISIIVTESTDASDFYDGFGAAEITIGIRAYQWGWEYYYPKTIDLNYNVKSSYSSFIGNSLKYTTSSSGTRNANNLWKFYQNKNSDEVITPAHLLLLPLDNQKLLNFLDFNDIGSNKLKESMAFKKIKTISKTFNSNLVSTPTSLTEKYKKINNLYINDNSFLLSSNYGLLRQHNLLSLKSKLNLNNIVLDKQSYDKLLQNNLVSNSQTLKNSVFLSNFTQLKTNFFTSLNSNLLFFNLETLSTKKNLLNFYPSFSKIFNNNSDKVFFSYPLRKIFNSKFNNFFSYTNSFSSLFLTDNSQSLSLLNNEILNKDTLNKDLTLLSLNQNILPSDQTLRQANQINVNKTNFNLEGNLNFDINLSHFDLNNKYFNFKTNLFNSNLFYKLISNQTNLQAPFNPLFQVNNSFTKTINYDESNNLIDSISTTDNNNKLITHNYLLFKSNNIDILKGKRDGAPEFLNTTYWNMFWANTSPNLRINSILTSLSINEIPYIPMFNNYYDYDFRNLQAYELLEDLIWENNYSAYSHYDYLNIKLNEKKSQTLDLRTSMREPYFYQNNLDLKLKTKPLLNPTLKDLSLTGQYYTNSINSDDLLSPSNLLLESDFNIFPLLSTNITLDDSYESWNEFRKFEVMSINKFFFTSFFFNRPQSYLNVLNMFRANFEDFNWSNNDLKINLNKIWNPNMYSNILFNLNYLSNDLNNSSLRISNSLTLRLTARNSIVNFNALQKVFRARFEDGRANANLNQFSEITSVQPFLNTERVDYGSLLGKTKNSFFNNNFFVLNNLNILNESVDLNTSLNFHFFDFPFLLSAKAIWQDICDLIDMQNEEF